MLPPGAIFELKIHQNAFAAGTSLRTPLGKLTALPNLLTGFQGRLCALRQGRGREELGGEDGGEGTKEEGRKGERSPTSFLHFSHCLSYNGSLLPRHPAFENTYFNVFFLQNPKR